MSLKDFLFGGTDDSAQDATLRQNSDITKYNKQMTEKAYADVMRMFGPSIDALGQGAQSTIDYIQQSTPRRASILQQGNQRSRQATLGGLDQIQNAILGLPVDMSSLKFDPLQMPETAPVTAPVFDTSTLGGDPNATPAAFTWDKFIQQPGNEDLLSSYNGASWASSPAQWAQTFWVPEATRTGDPRLPGRNQAPQLGAGVN